MSFNPWENSEKDLYVDILNKDPKHKHAKVKYGNSYNPYDSTKKQWVQYETGKFEPVAAHGDISQKKRGKDRADWWVVEKDKDWFPAKNQQNKPQGKAVLDETFAPQTKPKSSDSLERYGNFEVLDEQPHIFFPDFDLRAENKIKKPTDTSNWKIKPPKFKRQSILADLGVNLGERLDKSISDFNPNAQALNALSQNPKASGDNLPEQNNTLGSLKLRREETTQNAQETKEQETGKQKIPQQNEQEASSLFKQKESEKQEYPQQEETTQEAEQAQNAIKPSPVPKEVLGTTEYYKWRHDDFKRRHPDKEPPSYYLEYGDKYAHVFSDEVRGKLSDKGKQWVDDTRRILQEKMEEGIASGKMDELDPEKFEEIAFDMHSDAYEEAGIHELPLEDVRETLRGVDFSDSLTLNALKELWEVARNEDINKRVHEAKNIMQNQLINLIEY